MIYHLKELAGLEEMVQLFTFRTILGVGHGQNSWSLYSNHLEHASK